MFALIAFAAVQDTATVAGDTVIHEVLAGVILAMLGAGIKVWADQRSDQRASRHEKQNRAQADAHVNERLERLETRTEAAIRLEAQVATLTIAVGSVASLSEDLRRTITDSALVLQYLKGRADQVDSDFARRRRTDG